MKYKLYLKYNTQPETYINNQLTFLLIGKQSHLVSTFKEQMIFGFNDEFLKRNYSYSESHDRLEQFPILYHKYLLFFCKPFFLNAFYNRLIHKYYESKAEAYYIEHCCSGRRDSLHSPNTPNEYDSLKQSNVFSSTINEDINHKSVSNSNIIQTNFEYCNSGSYNGNNALIKKRFIESICEMSLIYKRYNKASINSENTFIDESWCQCLSKITLSKQDATIENNTMREKTIVAETSSSTRIQCIKLKSISEKKEHKALPKLHKANTSDVNSFKPLKPIKKIIPKTKTQSQINIGKKANQKILIEVNSNTNTNANYNNNNDNDNDNDNEYNPSKRNKHSNNRYVIPHTKSTGDMMKVSFVLYTNHNKTKANRFRPQYHHNNQAQSTEFIVSAPSMNNVNINIQNKVNINPTYINNNLSSQRQRQRLSRMPQLKFGSSGLINQCSIAKSISRNRLGIDYSSCCNNNSNSNSNNYYPYQCNTNKEISQRTIPMHSKRQLNMNKLSMYRNAFQSAMKLAKIQESRKRMNSDPFYNRNTSIKELKNIETYQCNTKLFKSNSQMRMSTHIKT